MKLIITDLGDSSVGIFAQSWQVDCPFNREEVEPEDLEFFREKILETFTEFAQCRMIAQYDFELQAENEMP